MANLTGNFNHFPEIGAAMYKALSQVVRKTAFDIQAKAASLAPVDTGFLRNSIYTVTSEGSTYGAEPTKEGSFLLPEVEGADEMTAYVAVGANYGVYVNYGTHRMAAQPFWEPAIEAARPGFEMALAAIEDKIKAEVP